MKHPCRLLATLGILLTPHAADAITVDGMADSAYGLALAVQNVQTSFGDSSAGSIDNANGSEIDQAFGVVVSNTLHLLIAGNLEANFNKLELFFDTRDGGQNQLRGDNPDVDGNGLNRMGYASTNEPGLKFEANFAADYWLGVTGGGAPYMFYANYAELLTDSGNTNGYYLGTTSAGSDGTLAGGNNPFGIRATINNSNTGGVGGGTNTAWGLIFISDSGAGVVTGIELAIPLEAIGNPTGTIKVCTLINGMDHQFLSNQMLQGGLLVFCCPHPPPNLPSVGEPRTADLSAISNQQWFEVPVNCVAGTFSWASTNKTVREPPSSSEVPIVDLYAVRSGSICGPVTVKYVSSNVTAVGGSDFYATTGTLTFAQGLTIAGAATLSIMHDTLPEPPETFSAHLYDPSDGGLIGAASVATVTIRDEDGDEDGLSDDFENTYFGSTANAAATNDWDGDGMTELEENCAGTSPTNAASYLASEIEVAEGNPERVVTWPSADGRVYTLEFAGESGAAFDPVAMNLPATPPLNTYTDTLNSGVSGAYRVRLTAGCP